MTGYDIIWSTDISIMYNTISKSVEWSHFREIYHIAPYFHKKFVWCAVKDPSFNISNLITQEISCQPTNMRKKFKLSAFAVNWKDFCKSDGPTYGLSRFSP